MREAYQRFCELPDRVACLQAPLIIANNGQNWLTSLFALEYAGLFRGLLPLLAHYGLPMPLGGTSNHFRTEVLDKCGGWDPYNVTEDADLGIRLHRLGYRVETLYRATLEDAPTTVRAWFGQRTRWLKGWLQTWLVVMRHPIKAALDMGFAGTVCFHLLITAMLVSSLGHPLLLLFLLTGFVDFVSFSEVGIADRILRGIDFANIAGSYLLFILLGRGVMTSGERKRVGLNFLLVPIYWVLISGAAWKALLELRTNPFFWNKTAHKPSDSG